MLSDNFDLNIAFWAGWKWKDAGLQVAGWVKVSCDALDQPGKFTSPENGAIPIALLLLLLRPPSREKRFRWILQPFKLVISAVRLWHVNISEITCTVWRRFGSAVAGYCSNVHLTRERDYVRCVRKARVPLPAHLTQLARPQRQTTWWTLNRIHPGGHLLFVDGERRESLRSDMCPHICHCVHCFRLFCPPFAHGAVVSRIIHHGGSCRTSAGKFWWQEIYITRHTYGLRRFPSTRPDWSDSFNCSPANRARADFWHGRENFHSFRSFLSHLPCTFAEDWWMCWAFLSRQNCCTRLFDKCNL